MPGTSWSMWNVVVIVAVGLAFVCASELVRKQCRRMVCQRQPAASPVRQRAAGPVVERTVALATP